jgi:hypothetical protein
LRTAFSLRRISLGSNASTTLTELTGQKIVV